MRPHCGWVAKGYSQHYGVDYNEMFMLVIRLENLRLLLAYATANNLKINQMDVDSVFLQADLNKEVYITQPQGFKLTTNPHYICRLNKSLYGLKQAPLAWNHTLNHKLQDKLCFSLLEADLCIYLRQDKD
jgi:hypothetical protein